MQVMVAHASVASIKPKVELDSHVNVYSYDPKDGHRSAKTVHAAVGCGEKFILVIKRAFHIIV